METTSREDSELCSKLTVFSSSIHAFGADCVTSVPKILRHEGEKIGRPVDVRTREVWREGCVHVTLG